MEGCEPEGHAGPGQGHTVSGILTEGGASNDDDEDRLCANGCQFEVGQARGVSA